MGQYTYSTIYPKPNSIALWEVSLPNGHRMVLRKRRDITIPQGRRGRVMYQIRCTCKASVDDSWREGKMAHLQRIYVDQHISEVRKQGSLL